MKPTTKREKSLAHVTRRTILKRRQQRLATKLGLSHFATQNETLSKAVHVILALRLAISNHSGDRESHLQGGSQCGQSKSASGQTTAAKTDGDSISARMSTASSIVCEPSATSNRTTDLLGRRINCVESDTHSCVAQASTSGSCCHAPSVRRAVAVVTGTIVHSSPAGYRSPQVARHAKSVPYGLAVDDPSCASELLQSVGSGSPSITTHDVTESSADSEVNE